MPLRVSVELPATEARSCAENQSQRNNFTCSPTNLYDKLRLVVSNFYKTANRMLTVNLTTEDIESFAADCLHLTEDVTKRISYVLLLQLYMSYYTRSMSIFSVTDEINYLEGALPFTKTRMQNQFKRRPLRGLWKKHFYDDIFALRFFGSYWGLESGGNAKFERAIKDAFAENTSGFADQQFASSLISNITHPLMNMIFRTKPSKKLTGEWIIFQKFEGKNYYLTLGGHRNDDAIYRNVCLAVDTSFPFLSKTFGC